MSFWTVCLGRSPWWQGHEAEERLLVAYRTQRDRNGSGTIYPPPRPIPSYVLLARSQNLPKQCH